MTDDAGGRLPETRTFEPPPVAPGPVRLFAGVLSSVLLSSLLVTTLVGVVPHEASAATTVGAFWAAWSVFALVLAALLLPSALLLGWPLGVLTARWGPLAASLAFAALGAVVGVVLLFVLDAVDTDVLGGVVVALLGGVSGFVGRLLSDVVSRTRGLMVALSVLLGALVVSAAL
ncbi:hypothetical protein C1701_15945 [Actinoalloteichus sp. AHMU CJ021]|uniref:hypothetical protein n=1 Tax=Actinoalloteichus TaxID=65496 RepID=UPI0004ABA9FB|nr:hypothetical protein [Actinoalloteichus caeruleus]AUS79591.1 hypothetical protein C1701_15945 [Actinoalloteichus sp. AHMU CJ021]